MQTAVVKMKEYDVETKTNLNLRMVPYGNTLTRVCDYPMTIPRGVLEKLCEVLLLWQTKVAYDERTWVGRTYEIPSLLVRADCISLDGKLVVVCEIEDLPAGEFVTLCINRQFRKLLKKLRARHWPAFHALVADYRKNLSDVPQWLQWSPENTSGSRKPLVWISCRPDDRQFDEYLPWSVTTPTLEGDKRYLSALDELGVGGNARLVTAEDIPFFNWDEPFVVKPFGTRGFKVLVWWGDKNQEQKPRKCSSREKITREMQTLGGEWVFQEYTVHPLLPLELRNALVHETGDQSYTRHRYMHRIYAGFFPQENRMIPLGGMWLSLDGKKHAVYHGKEGALLGPLVLPSDVYRVTNQLLNRR